MYVRFFPTVNVLAILICSAGLVACNSLPRDPFDSLNKARERGFLRIGVSASPPWINHKEGDTPSGIEATILSEFAHSVGIGVEWSWAGAEENFQSLKNYDLDIAVGNFSKANPWKDEVGFTRPYFTEFLASRDEKKEHVMAAAPGENRLITELDAFLLGMDQRPLREQLEKDGGK